MIKSKKKQKALLADFNLGIRHATIEEAYMAFMLDGLGNLLIKKNYTDEEYKGKQKEKYSFYQ